MYLNLNLMKKYFINSLLFFYVSSISLSAQEDNIADVMNNNLNTKSELNSPKILNTNSKIFQGWKMGLNYGFTRFKGDVTQHDHYPAYQETGDFSELRTAASLSLIKRINPLYSISIELVKGKFAGLRRADQYMGLNVYDPYDNYEDRGDKFVADFSEIDLQLYVNLDNMVSYFSHYSKSNNINLFAKLGLGYNVFSSVRRNLFSDSYIYSYGYSDEGDNTIDTDYGTEKKPFFSQTTETVYIFGLRADYKLNDKINLHIDYSIRNAFGDKWDASIMSTQNKTDNLAFLSFGFTFNIGNHAYNNEWNSPLDVLKENVSNLNVEIEGFTQDLDNDGVADAFDKDSSTPIGVAVDGAGKSLDVDMDNVPDYRDADPFSNRGASVDKNGVEFDDDNDGVPNSKDLETNTPIGSMVNQFGISIDHSFSAKGIVSFPSIYFDLGSTLINTSNESKLATIAILLKNNKLLKLNVIGHTDNLGSNSNNQELGLKRANAVIDYLVSNFNLSVDRLFAKSLGEEDPLHVGSNSLNNQEQDLIYNNQLYINRRVDFEIRN